MLYNVRKHLPEAEMSCICPVPEVTARQHRIAAFPMKENPFEASARRATGRWRLLRKIVLGPALECYRWVAAWKTLRRTDVLVMTGTGMLADFGIKPFGLHYEILKWSLLAKLARCKLLFVSVGAGPLRHPLSRRFVRWALRLADYRSYRDEFSREYLASIGCGTANDPVYPDLAFSLPPDSLPNSNGRAPSRPVIGVGVMRYDNERNFPVNGETAYHGYLNKLATFLLWLIEHDYTVRLFIGDASYDDGVIQDVKRLLVERGAGKRTKQILHEPMACVEDLLTQLTATDLVLASRFHNLVLAVMLNKVVGSISYHEKIESLMLELGLEAYRQDIDDLDINRLIGQLSSLEANADRIRSQIRHKTELYRQALDRQYASIFNMV